MKYLWKISHNQLMRLHAKTVELRQMDGLSLGRAINVVCSDRPFKSKEHASTFRQWLAGKIVELETNNHKGGA